MQIFGQEAKPFYTSGYYSFSTNASSAANFSYRTFFRSSSEIQLPLCV